jgi:diacylglycerol kinase (ATP)
MSTRRILVIINALSGRRYATRARKIATEMLTRAELDHEIVSTRSMRELRRAAATAVGKGFTEIACVGGDGTVGMIANQIADQRIVLSLIPGGTGNILAKHLDVPLRLRAAVRVMIASEYITPLDCIDRNGHLHVLNLSMGLSSLAMTDIDGRMKRMLGAAAYFLLVLMHLVRRGPARFRVVVDGQEYRARGHEVLVTNAGFSKTAIAPCFADSSPHDGRLELSIFHVSGGRGLLSMLIDLLFQRSVHRDRYLQRIYATESIELSSEPPLPFQADGDPIGEGPVAARIRPAVLRVRVPDPDEGLIDRAIGELSPVKPADR